MRSIGDSEIFDTDVAEIRNIDDDVDLDMFASEPARTRADVSVMSAESRANLHVVQQSTAEYRAPEIEEAGHGLRAGAESAAVHFRLIATAGSTPQRIAIATVGIVAIGAAIWWAAALQTNQVELASEPSIAEPAQTQTAAVRDLSSIAPVLPSSAGIPASDSTLTLGSQPAVPVLAPAGPVTPSAVRTLPPAPAAAAPIASEAAGVVAIGYLRVLSAIDLDISNGGNVIGTTRAERTMLQAGDYNLLFANDQIGYREMRRVSIAAGRVREVEIRIPDGLVSVNAKPWANVSIDGKPVGETPLGNVTVAPGTHQLVFAHPELGQRRVETVVRSGQHVRLNVDLTENQD